MGLRIASNIPSQVVQKNLRKNTNNIQSEYEKLSSGKRITKSADDAAGLAIGTALEAQTRGLRQATRNANDGIALIQTAEGGLSETMNIAVRLRELTIQAASDTLGDKERALLDQEYQQLVIETDRIAQATTFNGAKLLAGEGDELEFQVGAFGGDQNKIAFDAGEADASADAIGFSGTSVESKDDAIDSIDTIDESIEVLSAMRSRLGSIQSRLQSTVSNLEVQTINQDQARAVIMDVDVADSTSKLASQNVVKNAAVSTLTQANSLPGAALRLIG